MGNDSEEVVGINCIQDLYEAEKLMNKRSR